MLVTTFSFIHGESSLKGKQPGSRAIWNPFTHKKKYFLPDPL
jgi:hypothetical protein